MVRIEHDVFERQPHAALPNPDFHPGLVVVRRCRRCRTLDDRAWFASPDAAASEAARSGWSCRVCSGTRVVPMRAWFDTLYGTRRSTPQPRAAAALRLRAMARAAQGSPPLLIDYYELTMAASYLAEGIAERPATFELGCRTLPRGWGYLLNAGLAGLLEALESFAFDDELLSFLAASGRFDEPFLARLERLRFGGTVRAMAEGSVWSAGEPLVEVSGSLFETQLVETTVINRLTFPSLVAAKASRCVEAAQGRTLVDFALRRTQGGDAGLQVARGSYLAGFAATSNVAAAAGHGIPVSGTMAHSYVTAFGGDDAAFAAFTRAYPDGTTLLLDTYDTLAGARRAVVAGRELAARGGRLGGVRLDSGDLAALSREVRSLLDEAGLAEVAIFASGNLDEFAIAALLEAGAPIDGFGVGTRMGVSADAPAIDTAYKLVALDGRPLMKLSPGKRTLPGAKQVWRLRRQGLFAGDLVGLADEAAPAGGEALLATVMEDGVALGAEPLAAARARAAEQRAALAERHRRLDADPYPVETSPALAALAARVEREFAAREA